MLYTPKKNPPQQPIIWCDSPHDDGRYDNSTCHGYQEGYPLCIYTTGSDTNDAFGCLPGGRTNISTMDKPNSLSQMPLIKIEIVKNCSNKKLVVFLNKASNFVCNYIYKCSLLCQLPPNYQSRTYHDGTRIWIQRSSDGDVLARDW
jgi:hypothetical protein